MSLTEWARNVFIAVTSINIKSFETIGFLKVAMPLYNYAVTLYGDRGLVGW